jgi:hypothetical protein
MDTPPLTELEHPWLISLKTFGSDQLPSSVFNPRFSACIRG